MTVTNTQGKLIEHKVYETKEESPLTVRQLKDAATGGLYKDIESEEFYVWGVLDNNDEDIVNTPFVKYLVKIK